MKKKRRRGNGEGTIFEDKKNKRWIGQYISGIAEDGKAIRKSVYGKTQKEVLNKLNEVKYQMNNDIYVEKNGIKLVKIMEDIREEKLASNTISGGQYARLKWTINKIKNSKLGEMKIQDVTKNDIQEFLNSIKDLSDSYIKKLYEQFVQAYRRAEIKKYITYNPMYEVIKPKSDKQTKVVEALDINVQKAFTEYLNKASIEDEPYKNIFLIQMYMGLRIGEVLALSTENIDLENKLLYVKRTLTNDKEFAIILGNKTKTYAGNRTLPIPDFLMPIFEEQLKYANGNLHNLIFTTNDNYIRTSAINKELKRIFDEELKTSSKNISTHCLRHTYGTRCIEAGMTAVVLQRLMGHKDVTVTLNTYTSVFNKFKEDELEKVNNYLTNNQLNFVNSAK
ncbi:MAG: site-specific integrase [Clostridia bacterium]|nr:site-specific integrase [Clostridia bacterium]